MDEHLRLWSWRMRGGAHEEVVARFSGVTERAMAAALDHWAATVDGRLALILILDQFTRSVYAGRVQAHAGDYRANKAGFLPVQGNSTLDGRGTGAHAGPVSAR